MTLPDFPSVQAYLNSLVNYEQDFPLGGNRDFPKLEPTLAAIEQLGLSQILSNCIHIAGTKGKGSTVAYLEALLKDDFKTLAFTSPHLISVKERIKLIGEILSDELWQKGFSAITQEPKIKLTYFETTFIFYLWAARELQTQVHLVETGLGGRWDSTNVLQKTIAVLTPVDYDHTKVLGNTLTEIATEKAGIIKPNSQVVISSQHPESMKVFEKTLQDQSAKAHILHPRFSGGVGGGWYFSWQPQPDEKFSYFDNEVEYKNLELNLFGDHQKNNAATAIRAARLIAPDLTESQIRNRLKQCFIPARQQLFSGNPNILLDVAHNPASFAVLAETLRKNYSNKKIIAVIGMSKDKDAKSSITHLKNLVNKIWLVKLSNPRSYALEDLKKITDELGIESETIEPQSLAFEKLHALEIDLGIVVGSFYLAGDYLEWRNHARIA